MPNATLICCPGDTVKASLIATTADTGSFFKVNPSE